MPERNVLSDTFTFLRTLLLTSPRQGCGHFDGIRILVDISSSNFPRFDVNPDSGEAGNDCRRKITATNTIHHDRDPPSDIVLPLIRPASES